MKTLNKEQIKSINEVYTTKGLKGVYSFLKANGYSFRKDVVEFGLNTNKTANEEKSNFINHTQLQFHYYSRGVKCRKSGYGYNVIRGIKLQLN